MTKQNLLKYFITWLICITPLVVQAQSSGSIEGTVVNNQTEEPIAGANVYLPDLEAGAATNTDGSFSISSIPPGTYEVEISFTGYQTETQSITINEGESRELTVQLSPLRTRMQGINVTALRPDLKVDADLQQDQIREANPRDSGELLRSVEGVDAVRRGPVGLDPVVRGLRETEVGTYLDGTRIFPAGPARMDSPLSHIDPSMIEDIQVVKGPYALNWGAGNMSAIRVQTQPLHTLNTPFGGQFMSGYDSNFNTLEEAASIYGRSGKVGYLLSGAWRSGNDYSSGDGTDIPGDYLSRELRGKASYATSSNSHFTLSLGYQNQEEIDYPGRLLDADYFDTYNASAGWEWNPQKDGVLQNISAKAYLSNISHGMDNDDKPTAQPDPDRMPPFATDVHVDTKSNVYGANIAATISTHPGWEWEIGTDFYHSYREAMRTITRRDNGQELSFNFIWPEATITDGGLYNRFSYSFSDRLSVTASLRLDLVSANADTISEFFEQNVSDNRDSREANLSASGTINYHFSESWTLGLGLGSVVRTADATERYSDRQPSSKSQTSAEFVGNPTLDPERSTQADLWLDGDYEKLNLSMNGFVRQMDNYITLEATDLPSRQPMSPETVYQYFNGSAQYAGFDISGRYRFIDPLQLSGTFSYLWGEDTTLDEPALGVAPLSGSAGLRYNITPDIFAESTAEFTGKQDRVATTRGETSTDGYTVINFQGGWNFSNAVSLRLGVKNLFNRQYVNHLNSKNPYTMSPIAEPGRVFFGDVRINF